VDARVEFILVGGLSGVLNGAPIVTYDADIVHRREPANLERLLSALAGLDAIYRAQPERKLRPSRSHLAGDGHQNLTTRLGWLDVLSTVGVTRVDAYEDLLPHSHAVLPGENFSVNVLDLDLYITLKEELHDPKDLAALPTLRKTLQERRKAGG